MIDNLIHNTFFSLLRSGLWSVPADRASFPLSERAWLQIFQLARKQTVEAIIYDGIMTLPTTLFPPKALIYKWAVAVDAIERQNRLMDQRINELAKLFSENGLTTYLLKGQGVARCYPNPHHRVCGDIDLFLSSTDEYRMANALIEKKGISINKAPGFSTEYLWKDIEVEHHRRFIDIHNPFAMNKLRKIFKTEVSNSIKTRIGSQEILTPSPLMTNLIVNTHILKHSLSFGIGLRQLCDSAKVCSMYNMEIDGTKIKEIYNNIGMLRWMQLLNQLLVDYLGLAPDHLPFELQRTDNPNWLLNEIMQAGNFGFGDTRFGENSPSNTKRKHPAKQLLHRFRLNFRYAPGEALSFPVAQISSRIINCF